MVEVVSDEREDDSDEAMDEAEDSSCACARGAIVKKLRVRNVERVFIGMWGNVTRNRVNTSLPLCKAPPLSPS